MKLQVLHFFTITFCAVVIIFSARSTRSQTVTSGLNSDDSVRIVHERRGAGGIESGYGWRNDGFHGLFFRLFYEAQIGKTFLNAGAFSYNKFNDGFGFDFRLRMPWIFYPSGSHTNFSPLAGIGFTVWPITKPTVTVGFPFGVEYEFLIEHFPNISVAVNAAPQVSLNAGNNAMIYDLRLGIRFD